MSVGTKTGFRLYTCETFGKYYENSKTVVRGLKELGVLLLSLQDTGGAGICQMMFSSSLVAIAGSGDGQSPRKVLILNTKVSGELNLTHSLTHAFAREKQSFVS